MKQRLFESDQMAFSIAKHLPQFVLIHRLV